MTALETVRTSVAGVAMGDEIVDEQGKKVKARQVALEYLRKLVEQMKEEGERRPVILALVPEPTNKFDHNAIQVFADIPELGGRTQLGYVRNRDTTCGYCLREFPKYPADGVCPVCKRSDHLDRKGLASRLSEAMKEDPNCRYYAELMEVTGGVGEKANFGCNIEIRRYKKRTQE
jgi:hypothetical protein